MMMTRQAVLKRAKEKAQKHRMLMGCGIEKEKNTKAYLEYMTYVKQLETRETQ